MANDSKAANIVGWMFHGSKKLPITAADLVRFRDKVTQQGDCLLWTASLNHEGYGRLRAILDLRRGGATFSSIDASLGIHRGAAYDIYHQHSRLRGIREALAAVRNCRVASGSEHDSCESAIVALLPKDVEW